LVKAVLFDLGNTLIWYYGRPEIPQILREAVTEVENFLRDMGLLRVSQEEMWRRMEKEENYEAKDYSVRPLEGRLARVFQLDPGSEELLATACRCFMKPIFARARLYEDSLPVLRELRSRGFKTAIVSNTSWGSPAALWREELARHGLSEQVDATVFCRDVGWRKPDRRIFEFTLEKLQADAGDCVFVGDDPNWDMAGPRSFGMKAILIDRQGQFQGTEEESIRSLYELLTRIDLSAWEKEGTRF
jgi:putative hydrolase of the HAD superfamily